MAHNTFAALTMPTRTCTPADKATLRAREKETYRFRRTQDPNNFAIHARSNSRAPSALRGPSGQFLTPNVAKVAAGDHVHSLYSSDTVIPWKVGTPSEVGLVSAMQESARVMLPVHRNRLGKLRSVTVDLPGDLRSS